MSSSFVFSEEKNPIQLYQEIALSKKLDLNRYWRLLLHYRDPIFFGKSKSEADGNEFFFRQMVKPIQKQNYSKPFHLFQRASSRRNRRNKTTSIL
ncbi:hypothetical protein LEP1GSC124_0487 [Leptospira interrogans serovar Pyrogenes str. 200701872]|uniref:DUF7843 domain-containing protein n=1 Tax=Leptospira interrogans serovar Pyrogenes str. 200701872 TaxID=1193029 RepID=M6ZUT8_LEPIR|nr:hypothetical protein LEP1GSC124_0487 [Leptospira interrogans serovar Pyrogenes str. 200701872]